MASGRCARLSFLSLLTLTAILSFSTESLMLKLQMLLWTFPSGSTSLWSRNPSFCCADYSFSNSAGALGNHRDPDSWG